MKIIIFGPPGSGKGTQAKLMAKDLRIKHISTGDILREEIEKNSSVGKKIKKFIEKGELAPIDLNYIIKRIIPKTITKSGGL